MYESPLPQRLAQGERRAPHDCNGCTRLAWTERVQAIESRDYDTAAVRFSANMTECQAAAFQPEDCHLPPVNLGQRPPNTHEP
jgi:hypothetical protein